MRIIKLFAMVFFLVFLAGIIAANPQEVARQDLPQSMEPIPGSGWPMFRHDMMHTGHALSLAPRTGTVLWKISVGSAYPIKSSPAVVNQKVFFGVKGQMIALKETTGETVWKTPMAGDILASPAVDSRAGTAGLVFVVSYGTSTISTLSALDMLTGRVVWSTWMNTVSSPTFAYTTNTPSPGPVIPRGILYIGSGNNLVALNEDNGVILWRYNALGIIESTPAVDDKMVYFGTNANMVYALERYTGRPIWKFAARGAVASSPAVGEKFLVFGSNDGCIYALDKLSGSLFWAYNTGSMVTSSPAYFGGHIYIGSANGCLYKIDEIGRIVWQVNALGNVHSSPAVVDGKVYVGSYGSLGSAIFCFDDLTGDLIWSRQMQVLSSPAVADNTLFLTNMSGDVYAFRDLFTAE